jgi:hypothetical protein
LSSGDYDVKITAYNNLSGNVAESTEYAVTVS